MEIALKLSPSIGQSLLGIKGDNSILVAQQQLVLIQEVNKPIVRDWMLPL
jgi:hypothetical protein